MAKLLILFTVVPLLELYLLLFVGGLLGFWPTVGVVLVTGLLGAWLAKLEGLRVLRQWQDSLAEARMPEEGVLGGVLLLVGGVLLITPGIMTDVVGLLLLIPATRRLAADWLRPWLRRRIDRGVERGSFQVVDLGSMGGVDAAGWRRPGAAPPLHPSGGPAIIDVEAEEVHVHEK